MQQGPLEADSFTASQFTDINRNCRYIGLLTRVSQEYLSECLIHRVYDHNCPRQWVIRAWGRRAILLAEDSWVSLLCWYSVLSFARKVDECDAYTVRWALDRFETLGSGMF